MILPERVLGISGTMWMRFGRAILPIIVSMVAVNFSMISLLGKHAGFQRNVNFRDAALHLVDHRHHRGFGNFVDGKASGFEFLGAQAMSRNVDDIIYAAEDAEISIGGRTAPSAA